MINASTGGRRDIAKPFRRSWLRDLAAAVVAVAGLFGTVSSEAACSVKAIEMPVTIIGRQAIATVGINGTDVRLLVDTGAFFSSLTPAVAEQLKLRVTSMPANIRTMGALGEVDTGMTTVKSMRLLDKEIPDVDFVVGGAEVGGGTVGLLGRNVLDFTDMEYDLAHGMVRFMFPDDCNGKNMAYWAQDKPIASVARLRPGNDPFGPIRTVGKLDGRNVSMMLDSGAFSSLVSLSAIHKVGIADAAMDGGQMIQGWGPDLTKVMYAPLQSFELGEESIGPTRISVAEMDLHGTDMLLGIDFFLSHRIYVAKRERRIFFTYNGGPVFFTTPLPSGRAALSPADQGANEELADAAAYARRGNAAAARQDFAHAVADLDRACEMAPAVADYFTQRGLVHLAAGHAPLARKDFDTAISLDPKQDDARLHRASMRADSRARDAALEDLQVLDKSLPPQAHARLEMGFLYMRLYEPQHALDQFNPWLASHSGEPKLEQVYNARCTARSLLKIELDKALDDCDRSIKMQADNAVFLANRGWLHLRRGELKDAKADYDSSIRLGADKPWSLYGRAIVEGKLGDTEHSQADLDAARKLRPSIDADAQRYGMGVDD